MKRSKRGGKCYRKEKGRDTAGKRMCKKGNRRVTEGVERLRIGKGRDIGGEESAKGKKGRGRRGGTGIGPQGNEEGKGKGQISWGRRLNEGEGVQYAWRCSNFKHIGHGSRLSKLYCRKNLASQAGILYSQKKPQSNRVLYRAGN